MCGLQHLNNRISETFAVLMSSVAAESISFTIKSNGISWWGWSYGVLQVTRKMPLAKGCTCIIPESLSAHFDHALKGVEDTQHLIGSVLPLDQRPKGHNKNSDMAFWVLHNY